MPALATIDGIEILAASHGRPAGAAFRLREAAPKAGRIEAGGWIVEIREGASYVVASGAGPATYEHTWREGLTIALQGLDVLSAQGVADLALTRAADEHILGWSDSSGQVLRMVGTADFNVTVGVPTITITDAAGQLVPQARPSATWHESMRYYRQSQLADDVFDSYRNLWLATESLLDDIEPYQATDNEERWLKRALGAAHLQVDLTKVLPASPKAPHNAAYQYFYVDARTHLFHVKASRRPLLPDEPRGTNLLLDRHVALTQVYLKLLEGRTGVGRRGGFMFTAAFDHAIAGFDQGAAFLVTDDRSPLDPAGQSINPGGGALVAVPAQRSRSHARRGYAVFAGDTDGRSIGALRTIQKAAFSCDTGLIAAETVLGDLCVSGLDTFQVQMAFRLQNRSRPRSFNEM